MVYSKIICELLDNLTERIKRENEEMQKGGTNLVKYIAESITECMLQYRQSDCLKDNMTEKQLIMLCEYDEDKNMLKDIIDNIVDNENYYPLVLDMHYPYCMLVDFAEHIEDCGEYCMNCGAEVSLENEDISKDELGSYATCKKCGATFDIDM